MDTARVLINLLCLDEDKTTYVPRMVTITTMSKSDLDNNNVNKIALSLSIYHRPTKPNLYIFHFKASAR